MNYQQLLNRLSPDIVDRLRRGVETGRWPDGTALTDAQREHSLQAIIAWDNRHRPAGERVGYVHTVTHKGTRKETHNGVNEGMKSRKLPAANPAANPTVNAESELRWVGERHGDGE